MTAVTVRRAGRDDQPAVTSLIRAFYLVDGHPFDDDTVASGLGELLAADRWGTVLLLEEDGTAIGYCVLTWGWSIESGGLEALVDELSVEERGRGLGSTLLEHAIRVATEQGCRRVFLETERPNEAARRFYRRHGFVAENSIWMARTLP